MKNKGTIMNRDEITGTHELCLKLTDDGALALQQAVSALMNRTMEPWSTHLRDISHQVDAHVEARNARDA